MTGMLDNGVQFVAIDEDSAGQRIDNYLFRILKGVPKSHIYRLLRRGEVRVNGGRAKPTRKLVGGDTLRLPPIRMGDLSEASKPSYRLLEIIENSVIYEDDLMLVVNKPAGIAVHGGSGIAAGVIEALRVLRPEERHLELVHRLDRGTSGCLMIARRRSALRTLQGWLREKQALTKFYNVIVHGQWLASRTEVALALQKNTLKSGERISRVVSDGKASLTRYRVLEAGAHLTLLEAQPVTGRTHQIRVHCATCRCPVVGDEKYGNPVLDGLLSPPRMMLHARRLALPSLTQAGQQLVVEAVPDAQFTEFSRLINQQVKD
ncbi:MAG: RluA family pseudouridine synthase [Pseudomonadota bacterium]